jgi:hypothetical protein
MAEIVQITGIRELNAALKRVDAELPKGVRVALNEGVEKLAGYIRPQIPTDTGAARQSVKPGSTRTAARLRVGGAKARYYPWLDFGGQGRRKGRPAHRPFISEGRYVYPTLRKRKPELIDDLNNAIAGVIRGAGLEVTTDGG